MESGQKVEIYCYKIISTRNVMYSMTTIVNTLGHQGGSVHGFWKGTGILAGPKLVHNVMSKPGLCCRYPVDLLCLRGFCCFWVP